MDQSDAKKMKHVEIEQPTPSRIYPVIDTDLARDNIEKDTPDSDLEDLSCVDKKDADVKPLQRKGFRQVSQVQPLLTLCATPATSENVK